MKTKILIVDDDEEIRTQMKWALVDDYEVFTAEDRSSALITFREEKPTATLLDLGLPPRPNETGEGMAVLAGIQQLDRHAKVIVISGQGENENAKAAVGAGAFDFLSKPINTDELQFLLQRCCYVSDLEREYAREKELVGQDSFEGILGSSSEMLRLFVTIKKLAKAQAPVLILGESGTGKEVVARAIHEQSKRKKKPFIAINCSAIPENLIESELFGHEKGSFTGAHAQRDGLIESADGGTLFLDEIGDLPATVQVKLLRFLQEKYVQRVGGREEREVDTRIIAATNVDLKRVIAEGTFREDLYFRLAVVVCQLPPLRERGGDILLLAKEFLKRFSVENSRKGLSFTPEAQRILCAYPWPGNVRELQNRVQRSVIMADGKRISSDDLELAELAESMPPLTLREARENVEREVVTRALQKYSGKITAAAAELGVSRPTLYELMEKLKISRNELNSA